MSANIKISLVKLAAYYEKVLSPEQIQIYSEQLVQHLTDEECAVACRKYIDDPNNEFFPRPVSKLINLVHQPISPEDSAQNVSSLLLQAERAYGVHWEEGFFQDGKIIFKGKECAYESWPHAAVSVFGEVGLTIVRRYGGWKNFCMNVYESPDGVVRAQIKNLSMSLQNIKGATGSFDAIASYKSNQGLTRLGEIFELIGDQKGSE